jgi:capsular exopolysaccharide synthesis family protein
MSLEVQTKPQVLPPAESPIPPPASGGDKLTLMELWRVLTKQRLVILAVTILSLAGALWYALRTPSVYESVARIEIRPQESADIGIDQLIAQKEQGQPQNELQTEVSILQSDSVLFKTAQSLNLLELVRAAGAAAARKRGEPIPAADSPMSPVERRAMIQFIRNGLTAKVITGTNLVEIRYRNHDPKLAAAVVDRLVETYSDEDLSTKFERTMHVSAWLQKQLEGLKTEASNAQQALAEYQKEHNIVGTDENSNLTIQTLEDLSSALNDAEADRIMKEVRMRDFEALSPNLVGLMGDNPNVTTLRSRLEDLETQRAQLATQFGSKHPRMINLQSQIDNVQAQIDGEVALARRQVRNQYEAAQGVEVALRKRLDAQEEAAYKLNEGAAQYAILKNQAELTRDLYNTLQIRLKEASVTAGLSAANITVVDGAQVPYLPVAPQKRMSVLMGLLGGFLGGCVLAFLIESIDDRLQTSDEVESATMLPSLAAVPHLSLEAEDRKRQGKEEASSSAKRLNRQLVTLRDSKSIGAEAYRNLRSSLLLSSIDNPPRIVVVTSAFPKEGKTTTAINCAIVLAQRGEKVLLVDGDLRRGSLGAAFGLSGRTTSLTTMLPKHDVRREIPVPLAELPTLHVLPCGPRVPNPAELLSSARMEELLRQWSEEYDRIVLDTAPLLSVSDTQAVAVFADTVVLVTRAGLTRRRALVRARDILLRINAPVAGVVVNDVNVRLENFYTKRYGVYGYSYGYDGRYGSRYSDRAYGYEQEDKEDGEGQ